MFVLPATFIQTTIWLERLFVGSATFVFFTSYTLPRPLMSLQMDGYQAAIDDQVPPTVKGNDARTGEKGGSRAEEKVE